MGAFFSLSKSASLTALDVSEWALLVFGILLVIGLIIEYRAEHGSRWMKFGELLVIIGVAGELLGDGGIFLFSRHLQAIADHEIIELTKEAGTAKDSAKTAHEEADTVKKETDELTTRLGDAAKQLGLVEQDIRIQGPRSKLLIAAAPRLVKQLKLFAGQRVRLVVCGTQGSQDQETLDTWGAIANILGSDTVGGVTGAKWKEVPTNLNFSNRCGAGQGLGQGIRVGVSKNASKRTMKAGKALSEALFKTIPRSIYNGFSLSDPKIWQAFINHGLVDKTDPEAMEASDPDLVVVGIGAHPQK